jgi:hypothetical protein
MTDGRLGRTPLADDSIIFLSVESFNRENRRMLARACATGESEQMIAFPRTTLFLLLAAPCLTMAGDVLPIQNPGFEDGTNGWRIKESAPMSETTVDAAYQGDAGLRVNDNDAAEGSQVISSMVPVVPGAKYTVSFWAKSPTPPPFAGVFVWFYSPDKKLLNQENRPVAMVGAGDAKWRQQHLEITIPDGVGYAALWIHSLSKATGVADFDDFEIRESGDGSDPR